ncbi:MAG: hypothetical protein HQ510_06615 [Candidatus Marinimicrobia bacterium]|nr:hypothetical protein [Candidatus Neomarinimicrobiota bacterium]
MILKRAGNQCEECGVENYALGRRDDAGKFHYEPDNYKRQHLKIILTIAHLDHAITNNRFNNLRAWCQFCHLNYDRSHHQITRKYGQLEKQISLWQF